MERTDMRTFCAKSATDRLCSKGGESKVSDDMVQQTCTISGKTFDVSDAEIALRQKFGIEGLPTVAPKFRLRHLGAFWSHWSLHKRTCDKTGKTIVSIFSEDCPYPVWHRDEWIAHNDPPTLEFDPSRSVFDQMWELFQRCPIPHNTGTENENCDYTDDWWHSRNCYLCHSGYLCEDLRYCYRVIRTKDSHYCVFTFDCELCVDVTDGWNCFEVIHSVDVRNCRNSAFLYDCRNCSDCLFCFNLRNKQYCIGNKQLTKEEFEEAKKKWNFASRQTYDQAKRHFGEMMRTRAFHRAQKIEKCEQSTGNFLENNKNCENCFFISEAEDCANGIRSAEGVKDCLDAINFALHSELVLSSSGVLDRCYDIRFGVYIVQCRYMEYCAYCFQCEHCFGCCGLRGQKFCIFNKQYSEEEYHAQKAKIIEHMKSQGEYGQFFPGHFAPNSYDESCSAFYFPLPVGKQEKLGFRIKDSRNQNRPNDCASISDIPDASYEADETITAKIFWDEKAQKPFQIQSADIAFCQKLEVPLPDSSYMQRIQENFRWMPFDGALRETTCDQCSTPVQTTWPAEYDGRILCEGCYLNLVR